MYIFRYLYANELDKATTGMNVVTIGRCQVVKTRYKGKLLGDPSGVGQPGPSHFCSAVQDFFVEFESSNGHETPER